MEQLLLVAEHAGLRYEIIDGEELGFYVFAYDVNGKNTHDYLQDDIDMAKRCATDEFGVPSASWRPASEGERPLWQDNA